MPASLSDFMAQVNSHVGASGALFKAALNADLSTVAITRAPNASSPFVSFMPRVIYNYGYDTVTVGDGSNVAASPAGAFIAGLN